jgi:ferredoxin/flavodoxin---NADP+ reductase
MAYAITQTCCNDASCVSVCPVNCIHPTPQEREFGSTEMLHVDPKVCIDCGACADACPVDAIFPVDSLRGPEQAYAEINAAYFDRDGDATPPADPSPNFHAWEPPAFGRVLPADFPALRVAVVGTGPAGMYAVEDLVLNTPAEVTLVDRLPEPGGLVRYGVAPDHPSTKKVGETFARLHRHPRVRMHLGLQVGRDLTHDELAEHHDAVIYAVGAHADRRLGITGEDLPGSLAATTFVAWYNGHPDVAADAVDLSAERVVVVGTGNVALDVARILASDPATLSGTSIAPHALEALREGAVREVVLLGRRGPEDAAYTRPELLGLRHLDGVDLVVDDHDPAVGDTVDAAAGDDKAAILRGVTRRHIAWDTAPEPGRRVVLRFRSAPARVLGDHDGVRAVRVTGREGEQDVPAGTLLRAVGHRGRPVPGLPWEESSATVPHKGGRVEAMPGTYVTGWIKRGPSGGIGDNRRCATETVQTLLDDAVAGDLPRARGSRRAFTRLARRSRRR